MHCRQVFGFHDYTTDPRSGCPQPHYSWLGERLITWTAWMSAAILLIGGFANYVKWHDTDGFAQMMSAGTLFTAVALWRQKMLARKRSDYRAAVANYQAMLTKSVS